MFLGHKPPGEDEIGTVVEARNAAIRKRMAQLQDGAEHDRLLFTHGLLSFAEFARASRNANALNTKIRKDGNHLTRVHPGLLPGSGTAGRSVEPAPTETRIVVDDQVLSPPLYAFLQRWYDPERHPPTLQGWVQYLCDVCPEIADRLPLDGIAAEFPEPVRQMHTLITAASGWGKTELLKSLIHHYVAHDSAAVIVLDPHGDMAPQVAKWPEFRDGDRLVYVEPGLVPGSTVGINPLDATGLDADGIAVFADQLGTAIGELSSDLTGNMEMIARGCARLLLEDGRATLFDLLDLLENLPKKEPERPTEAQRNRARLIAKGREHPDRIMRRFFEGRLEADSLKGAREGMDNRISRLLFLPAFQAMTCGRSTVHLETLIAQRKVIVCNLAPLGIAGRAAMGRLIVALVAAIGQRREGTPIESRTPCHLFVDEAQTMASPTMADILFELRKFGIHLTLAQQVEGVKFDDVGQKALANSTQIKFVGANLKAALRPVFGDGDPPAGPELQRHQFWTRWGNDLAPVQVRVRSEFAGVGRQPPAYRMTEPEWRAVLARQLATYYRPVQEVPPPPQPAAEGRSGSSGDGTPPLSPPRPRRPL